MKLHRFLTEAVFDLKANLQGKLESDLLVAFGKPERIVPALVEQLQKQGMDVGAVWINSEVRLYSPRTESIARLLTRSFNDR